MLVLFALENHALPERSAFNEFSWARLHDRSCSWGCLLGEGFSSRHTSWCIGRINLLVEMYVDAWEGCLLVVHWERDITSIRRVRLRLQFELYFLGAAPNSQCVTQDAHETIRIPIDVCQRPNRMCELWWMPMEWNSAIKNLKSWYFRILRTMKGKHEG
jgi:hypothetical protein